MASRVRAQIVGGRKAVGGKHGAVVPVEVKASNSSTASLDRLLRRDDIAYGYKLTSGNVGVGGKKITLPHYMMMFI